MHNAFDIKVYDTWYTFYNIMYISWADPEKMSYKQGHSKLGGSWKSVIQARALQVRRILKKCHTSKGTPSWADPEKMSYKQGHSKLGESWKNVIQLWELTYLRELTYLQELTYLRVLQYSRLVCPDITELSTAMPASSTLQ